VSTKQEADHVDRQRRVVWAVVLVLVVLLVARIATVGKCDREMSLEPKAYRGEPASDLCGRRWSHDARSISCDRGTVPMTTLARFGQVESLKMNDVVLLNAGGAIRVESAEELLMERVRFAGGRFADAFPNLTGLALGGTPIEISDIRGLHRLKWLQLRRVRIEDLVSLAGMRALVALDLMEVDCGARGCVDDAVEQIHQLRPDMKIGVDLGTGYVVRHQGRRQ
jgi:hypothetical protein